jgi:methionyl-tRNA formyltransferase
MVSLVLEGKKAIATYTAPSREKLLMDFSCDFGKRLLDKELDEVEIRGTYMEDGEEKILDGSEYADSLEMKLGNIAAAVAAETLCDIASGKLQGVPQDPAQVTVCRKISKSEGRFSWNFEAEKIERMTRAFSPWPGAVCDYHNASGVPGVINICKAAVVSGFDLAPGECAELPGKLIVGCGGKNALEILELIPSGAKRMNAAAFRNGLRGQLPVFPEEISI